MIINQQYKRFSFVTDPFLFLGEALEAGAPDNLSSIIIGLL